MAKPSAFGRRLRELREERGITQEALGSKAQISPLMVSHFETGRRQTPSIESLIKLANALYVSADYLIGRTDEKVPSAGPLDAIFRSEAWEKSENLVRFLQHLANVWAREDSEREEKS